MTFPAWYDFYRDDVIRRHPAAMQVYAAILAIDDAFYEPCPVKAWALAQSEGLRKKTVIRALDLLVERGYLDEHARGGNNVRRFSVRRHRKALPATSSPKDTTSDAA